VGISTVQCDDDDGDCHTDECYRDGPVSSLKEFWCNASGASSTACTYEAILFSFSNLIIAPNHISRSSSTFTCSSTLATTF